MKDHSPREPRRVLSVPVVPARIESYIDQKTRGRVASLKVECTEDRVIVRGRCGSHHVKQLALLAAQEVLGALVIELDIDVGRGARHRQHVHSHSAT